MSGRAAHRPTKVILTLVLLAASAVQGSVAGAGAADAGTISGVAFQDLDRDGVRDAGEAPFVGHQLYLFDAAATTYFGTTLTDDAGRYRFEGLADGDYLVEVEGSAWYAIRREWVPSTTGSVLPKHPVRLLDAATADFGWRPIVRSTTLGAPVSRHVGPSGLVVESYDDVVSAREVHDAVVRGLVGVEAPSVTVRFDLGGDTTSTSVSIGSDGRYERFGADVSASYLSWLDVGDTKLSHEYGHAWSLYHAYVTQQDPTLAAYLATRGLTADPRLGTSHAWSPREMIAEDYRQLFGSPSARVASQENASIAPASEVAGLREFLRDAFTVVPATAGTVAAPTPLLVTALSVTPSPVRSSGTVTWSLSGPARVTVVIVNAKGSTVRTLARDLPTGAGPVAMAWDRTTDTGRRAGKGTYTVKVTAVDAGGSSAASTNTFSVA